MSRCFAPSAKPGEIFYARTHFARLAEFPADGAILVRKMRLTSLHEQSILLAPTELSAPDKMHA